MSCDAVNAGGRGNDTGVSCATQGSGHSVAGLYVHVPFCERKCGYCSFYSVRLSDGDVSSWLDRIELEAQQHHSASIRTLYIGGGTPTVLTLSQWQQLMNILREHFDLSEVIEATSEANPNSLTPEHIAFFQDNNFTRVSLGVQSLNDDELHMLGRIHDSNIALRAMELVKSSGLILSCDLIFAIPGQTLRTWDSSLRTVMQYASHISTYQLTLEPDTPMGKCYDNVDLNTQGYKFYRYAQYMLPRHGFTQYEISSFAPDGFECRHNMAYWDLSDIIALGPSAVSYLDGVRYSDSMREELSDRDRAIELAILSLRTKWGIARKDLLPEVETVLISMPDDLFVMTPERIALSPRGMRVGNAIWCELIDL